MANILNKRKMNFPSKLFVFLPQKNHKRLMSTPGSIKADFYVHYMGKMMFPHQPEVLIVPNPCQTSM